MKVSYYILSESSSSANTDVNVAVRAAITSANDARVVAILGPNSSSSSKSVHPIAQAFSMPYISYASTSTELSDEQTYPFLFRVSPPDNSQADAMVALVERMKWKSIHIINTRDTYGSTGASAVAIKANKRNIAVTTQQEIFPIREESVIIESLLTRIEESATRIIILFMNEQDAVKILKIAKTMGIAGGNWVWIFSDGFTGTKLEDFGLKDIARGFLGYGPAASYNNSIFHEWNITWSSEYNKQGNILTDFANRSSSNFYTGLPESALPKSYTSYGTNLNTYAPFAFDGMTLILSSIVELAKENKLCNCTVEPMACRDIMQSRLKATSVNGVTGKVSFDAAGDRETAIYDLLNHNGIEWVRIASYAANRNDSLLDLSRNLRLSPPYTAATVPVWPSGKQGFANAPIAELESTMKAENDNSVFFYAVLGVVPLLAILFYCLIKRKGEEWAALIGKILNETTKIAFDTVLNLLDFSTDMLSYLVVLSDDSLKRFIVPYTIFLILAGLCTLTHTALAMMFVRSLLCKSDGKYALAGNISEWQRKHMHLKYGSSKMYGEQSNKELQFLLNKSVHGVTVGLVSLFTALFEDFPFMIMNALILVQEGEVNLIVLLSFALNCFICGTAPMIMAEIVRNHQTKQRLLEAIKEAEYKRKISTIPEEKEGNSSVELNGSSPTTVLPASIRNRANSKASFFTPRSSLEGVKNDFNGTLTERIKGNLQRKSSTVMLKEIYQSRKSNDATLSSINVDSASKLTRFIKSKSMPSEPTNECKHSKTPNTCEDSLKMKKRFSTGTLFSSSIRSSAPRNLRNERSLRRMSARFITEEFLEDGKNSLSPRAHQSLKGIPKDPNATFESANGNSDVATSNSPITGDKSFVVPGIDPSQTRYNTSVQMEQNPEKPSGVLHRGARPHRKIISERILSEGYKEGDSGNILEKGNSRERKVETPLAATNLNQQGLPPDSLGVIQSISSSPKGIFLQELSPGSTKKSVSSPID
eukprot:CAMPEP_0114501502 /NCGR_PEP_ID=MMETSP0109-20121206/8531_1 /TAXON_ID=29199 /ORGANISM="Chlorarachnion reptans, Strain CCCM449" /LENGTH=989 /DNA_ID=CAMNT_0001679233 /DNA_START=254 /DNA_END=3223 /DNA_ORIENTATION=+